MLLIYRQSIVNMLLRQEPSEVSVLSLIKVP